MDHQIHSPQPISQNLSKDKVIGTNKKTNKEITSSGHKISKYLLPEKRKISSIYEEKLD